MRFRFFLFFIGIFIFGCSQAFSQNKNQVCFQSQCFEVELALTPQEAQKGLMFRTSLDVDKGMLFVFPQEGFYPFWMENTLIPLDMIWFDQSRRVIYIEHDVPPCKEDPCPTYGPRGSSSYVLEVNAGASAALNIKTGDIVQFQIPESNLQK